MVANPRSPGSIEGIGPAAGALSVTPHDSNNLSTNSRSLYVGVGGNVAVLMVDDTTATFVGVPSGTTLPIRVKRVNNTNTTASSIIALI